MEGWLAAQAEAGCDWDIMGSGFQLDVDIQIPTWDTSIRVTALEPQGSTPSLPESPALRALGKPWPVS